MSKQVQMPRHARAAELRAGSFNEAANTVDVVWTTGADVLRCDYFDGNYIERLATDPENVRLDRLNSGAAFLDTHNSYQLASVIGAVVPGSARMEDGMGLASIKLSRAAGAAEIVQNIQDGIISNVSVGYITHAYTRTEASDGSPAIMVATDWEPVELSAVPVPADPGAQIRAATRGASGVELFPCRIERADAPNQEAAMADNNTPAATPGDANAKKPTDAGVSSQSPAAQPGPQPNNPSNNPDMVHETLNKPSPQQVPGQPVVVDPGDAHPLPLTKEEMDRKIEEGVQRALAGERERVRAIGEDALKFGQREFGDEHIRAGTSVKKFRNALLDKLAEDRLKDGGPTHSASRNEPSLDSTLRSDRAAGEAWARRVSKQARKAAGGCLI